jgi:deoxycytidine triphosphate deaminase
MSTNLKRIIIKGLADIERQIVPCSVDLRLSNKIRRFKKKTMEMESKT